MTSTLPLSVSLLLSTTHVGKIVDIRKRIRWVKLPVTNCTQSKIKTPGIVWWPSILYKSFIELHDDLDERLSTFRSLCLLESNKSKTSLQHKEQRTNTNEPVVAYIIGFSTPLVRTLLKYSYTPNDTFTLNEESQNIEVKDFYDFREEIINFAYSSPSNSKLKFVFRENVNLADRFLAMAVFRSRNTEEFNVSDKKDTNDVSLTDVQEGTTQNPSADSHGQIELKEICSNGNREKYNMRLDETSIESGTNFFPNVDPFVGREEKKNVRYFGPKYDGEDLKNDVKPYLNRYCATNGKPLRSSRRIRASNLKPVNYREDDSQEQIFDLDEMSTTNTSSISTVDNNLQVDVDESDKEESNLHSITPISNRAKRRFKQVNYTEEDFDSDPYDNIDVDNNNNRWEKDQKSSPGQTYTTITSNLPITETNQGYILPVDVEKTSREDNTSHSTVSIANRELQNDATKFVSTKGVENYLSIGNTSGERTKNEMREDETQRAEDNKKVTGVADRANEDIFTSKSGASKVFDVRFYSEGYKEIITAMSHECANQVFTGGEDQPSNSTTLQCKSSFFLERFKVWHQCLENGWEYDGQHFVQPQCDPSSNKCILGKHYFSSIDDVVNFCKHDTISEPEFRTKNQTIVDSSIVENDAHDYVRLNTALSKVCLVQKKDDSSANVCALSKVIETYERKEKKKENKIARKKKRKEMEMKVKGVCTGKYDGDVTFNCVNAQTLEEDKRDEEKSAFITPIHSKIKNDLKGYARLTTSSEKDVEDVSASTKRKNRLKSVSRDLRFSDSSSCVQVKSMQYMQKRKRGNKITRPWKL